MVKIPIDYGVIDVTSSWVQTTMLKAIYNCYGKFSNETSCSGNGKCLDTNICKCNEGFFGNNCEHSKNRISIFGYNNVEYNFNFN